MVLPSHVLHRLPLSSHSKHIILTSHPTADKTKEATTAEEKILGDKAVGGVDADADHVPNVVSGLKGYAYRIFLHWSQYRPC
jgi:hypothetical protein